MWLHDMFDFEHLICVIFSLIAYSPVYAVAKFFMRKKVPQKLIFRIIIMIIVGYITLSIRYFVLGFLGIDATFIWFFSLFYGWHILFNREMDEFEKGVHLSKENPALTNEEPPCVEIPSAPIAPLKEIKYDELYKEMDEFEVGPAIQFLQMAILLYFLKSMGVFVGTRGHFMPIYIFILQLPPHPSIL